ncbi:MAG: aminotransferase class I/II-fold pyridoxal phosphate-dependent enzyme [Bacteroidales bacterium]
MKTTTILPASRVNNIHEYYFSKKLSQIREMNSKGQDIINLGIGNPDFPPERKVINTLIADVRKKDAHGYQSYTGIPELRKAYAYWYKKYFNVELNAEEEILSLIGSKEGILHISLTFINPGDGVLIPNPGYPTYTSVSKLVGAHIVNYNLDEKNNWEPNFDEIEKEDLTNIKLMWVNYPNMPTGAKASIKMLEKLVKFGRKHDIIICNDNPYSFILNDDYKSLLSISNSKGICIELNSMSKSHCMSGWRFGMVASNSTFINWMLKVESNIDSGQFRPMQKAAVRALYLDANWYKNINKKYKKRRILVEQIMETLGCTIDTRQSGLFLWGKIPKKYVQSEELTENILDKAKVFITPGFIFGDKGNKYIRISLCEEEKILKEANNRIKKIL